MTLVRSVLSAIVAAGLLVGSGPAGAAPKKPPCAANLAACPTRGCEPAGTAHALMNQAKRSVPSSGEPTRLTLDDFASLQDEADTRLGDKQKTLTKQARAKLKNLPVGGGTVSEGDLVELVGFIVGLPNRPSANTSGESVNCRLKGEPNNDFHIPIARRWTHSEFRAIVVEMIPQDRNTKWELDRLHAAAQQGRQVRIRGQLFYDNEHVVNDDPDDPIKGQPKRFSLWEIHPITEFMVCTTPNKACDPANAPLWQALEDADDLEE
jgi:hypothetical protein